MMGRLKATQRQLMKVVMAKMKMNTVKHCVEFVVKIMVQIMSFGLGVMYVKGGSMVSV